MDSKVKDNFDQRLNDIKIMSDDLPAVFVIHHIESQRLVYMNKPGLENLGATLEELQALSQEEYQAKFFNSEESRDYVPKLFNLIINSSKEKVSFFQQVRSPLNSEWQLYASNSKIFAWNEAGEATHLITIAGILDPVHHISAKVNRLIDEASFLRNNILLFAKLTRRERELLKYIAMGLNSAEIAKKLFISTATAETHRRNIRNKLSLKSNYDAVKFAQAYNLI